MGLKGENMNIPWSLIALFLAIILVLQQVRIIKLGRRIKELRHYIDMFGKNKEIQ